MNSEQSHPEIHDRYLAKVNELVGTDHEHLIAEVTAEYALVLDRAEAQRRAA